MDNKEARNILGISKDASKNDIERKYAVILKKYRIGISQSNTDEEEVKRQRVSESDFKRITEAYNVLMGYEIEEKKKPPSKTALMFKKVGVDEEKTKNFFYYYKFYILGIILVIAATIYFINGCVNRVVPDFNTAFIGRIGYYESIESLHDSVRDNIQEIDEPGFDGAYFDESINGEQLYAMEMKVSVLFGAADIDVFIVDSEYYQRFAKQGLFMNLDEIAPRLGVDVSNSQDLILSVQEQSDDLDEISRGEGMETEIGDSDDTSEGSFEDPHLYGIDVTNSTALKESGVIADKMIAAIFLGTKQQEKAEAFLEFLLK